VGTIEKAGAGRAGSGKKKDPARAAPAFSIVAADREPGKG